MKTIAIVFNDITHSKLSWSSFLCVGILISEENWLEHKMLHIFYLRLFFLLLKDGPISLLIFCHNSDLMVIIFYSYPSSIELAATSVLSCHAQDTWTWTWTWKCLFDKKKTNTNMKQGDGIVHKRMFYVGRTLQMCWAHRLRKSHP